MTDKKTQTQIHKHHTQAENTAKHYGFNYFGSVKVEKQDIAKIKNFKDNRKNTVRDENSILNFDDLLEEKIALMRSYLNKEMVELPQPSMIYYSGPIGESMDPKVKTFNIDILGNANRIYD
jgi:hypothetical protein